MMSRRKFKVWVNSLLDEGYDLSDYTWDELYDEYLNEAGNPGGAITQQASLERATRERKEAPQRARNQRIQQNLTSSWAQQQLNKNSPYAPSTAPTGLEAAARNILTTPRPNYNPPPSTNEKAFRDTGGFAAQAQRATDPVQKVYYNTMSQKASTVNASTLSKPEGQKVTAGREYDATLKGKPVKVTYDLTGKRSVKEEFEAWVDELHEQGYDLSNYTWEGLFEYYCDEVLSEAGQTSNPFRPTNKFNPYNFDTSSSLVGNTSSSRSSGVSFPSTPSTSATITRTSPAMSSRALAPQTKSNAPSLQSKDMSANYATWAKANPVLAAKVKPGQAGYDSIKSQLTTSSYTTPKSIVGQNKDINTSGSQSGAAFSPSSTLNFRPSSYSSPALNSSASQTSNVSTAGSSAGRAAFGSNSTSTTSNPPTSTNMQNKRNSSPGGSSKPGSVYSSFDFGKSNYITEDVNYLYRSIYEGNRVDQDEDGDNDGADVMIARMIASGMSKEEAIRRTRNKLYNKKGKKSDEELKEFAALVPLVARAADPLAGRLVGSAVARGVAGNAAQGGLRSGLGRLAGNLAGNKVRRKLETMGQQDDSDEESKDESLAYEILNHLIENGYADTPEQAAAMFENFSEDYQYAIIEHLQSF